MRAVVFVRFYCVVPVLFVLLTGLISYCAGSLACGLAGSLALTTATLFDCVL
mgnify:FL=1